MLTLKNVVALLGCIILSIATANANQVNVLADRSEFHLLPIFEAFENDTGIEVNVAFVEKGSLPARLASGVDNPDVIIGTNLSSVVLAKEKGYTKPITSDYVRSLDQNIIDPEYHYSALSFRARTLVYNRDVVDPNSLTGYEDLASENYAGRVCVRPLTHTYNVTLVAAMIADKGVDHATNWVKGLADNLAVEPSGNDRKQGTLVAQGVCDIGIMNTYYYGLLMSNNDQRPVANATQLFFPEQSENGTYVLYSGVAMGADSQNTTEANSLIEYMLGPVGQNHFAHVNFEYPVIDGVPYSIITQGFGEGQAGIKDGNAKFNHVNPALVAENREKAFEILLNASK